MQQALGLPILPRGADLQALSNDPFRFFVRADGTFVLNGKAGDFLDTERFGYTYDQLASPGAELSQGLRLALPVQATIKRGVASITLPAGAGGASTRSVVATVTVARPTARSSPRQFDVLVNAPPDVTTVDHDSPYYGGTVAFFGPPMPGMTHEATFAVPLSSRVRTLAAPDALEGPLRLQLRLVPQQKAKSQTVPAIKAASARRL